MKYSKWLAIISCSFLIILFIVWLLSYLHTFPGVKPGEWTVHKQAALDISIEASNSLASLTILILSGVWGFILVQSKKIGLRRWDLMTVIAGTLTFVLSYISYRLVLSKHIEILYKAQTIDLTAPIVNFGSRWQWVFLFLGVGIFTFLFGFKYNREGGEV